MGLGLHVEICITQNLMPLLFGHHGLTDSEAQEVIPMHVLRLLPSHA